MDTIEKSRAPLPPTPELAVAWSRRLDDYIAALSVSPDGGLIAVGTSGGQLRVYETTSGGLAFERQAHPGGVLACRFAPHLPVLATAGQDGYARIFDPSGSVQASVSGGAASVAHVAWSPSGQHFATASGRTARVWTADGKPLFELAPTASTLGAVGWNHVGTQLAVASPGGVRLVDARRGSHVAELPWNSSLICLAWSPDDSVIACGARECSVHLWRLPEGKDAEISGFAAQPRAIGWSPDSKLLATSGGPAISLWSFEDGPEGKRPTLLTAHQALCTVLAFHPTRPSLVSGGDDAAVCVWRPREANRPLSIGWMEETVTAVAWASAPSVVVAGDASGLLRAFHTPYPLSP